MADLTPREEQRLRRALATAGEEIIRAHVSDLAEPRVTSTRWWRRRSPVVAAGLLTTAGAVFAVVLVAIGGNGSNQEGVSASNHHGMMSKGWTWPESIACAKQIVVGDIVRVQDARVKGRMVVTLHVDRWLKPSDGPDQLDLNLVDPRTARERRLPPGTHALFIVPQRRDRYINRGVQEPVLSSMVTSIERALPEADQTTCPAPLRAK